MAGKNTFSVKAYAGDMKTLLAFNFSNKANAKDLAGFTIQCTPKGHPPYYLQNNLQYQSPGEHAQDPKEPANSTINAPLHKFRWLHVPGSVHQGTRPVVGPYIYTVTPRYLDGKGELQPIDTSLSKSITISVCPFAKNGLQLGFTRGFTQSQAFTHRFGLKALIQPKAKTLLFKTNQVSGTDPKGHSYTFADEYEWLGFTAREKILALLDTIIANKSLSLDMFAYDLNEPDILQRL